MKPLYLRFRGVSENRNSFRALRHILARIVGEDYRIIGENYPRYLGNDEVTIELSSNRRVWFIIGYSGNQNAEWVADVLDNRCFFWKSNYSFVRMEFARPTSSHMNPITMMARSLSGVDVT